MTSSQFAAASGTDQKWIENTLRQLNLRTKRTASDAMWLGLVKVLSQETGIPVARADELAREALACNPASTVIVGRTESGNTGVFIDLARYYSSYAASISMALDMGGPRRRGRPQRSNGRRTRQEALTRAAKYGVDLALLREGLKLSVAQRIERADENAAFVSALRRSPAPR